MNTRMAYRMPSGPGLTYRYKLGMKAGLIGAAAVLVALALTKPLLGSETEWHLFTGDDPFVIPGFVLKLIWCMVFGSGVVLLLCVALPPLHIAITENSVRAPNIPTRKYQELAWTDVVEVLVSKHGMTLTGLKDRVNIARLALSDEDWIDILRCINERVGSALVVAA